MAVALEMTLDVAKTTNVSAAMAVNVLALAAVADNKAMAVAISESVAMADNVAVAVNEAIPGQQQGAWALSPDARIRQEFPGTLAKILNTGTHLHGIRERARTWAIALVDCQNATII